MFWEIARQAALVFEVVCAALILSARALTEALQLAVVPPFVPAQLHVQGPVPETVDGVPVEQRFVVGADDTVVPFEDPQAPFTAGEPLPVMVTTAELAPRLAPLALVRVILRVLLPVKGAALLIGTEKVFAAASPFAQESVPLVLV